MAELNKKAGYHGTKWMIKIKIPGVQIRIERGGEWIWRGKQKHAHFSREADKLSDDLERELHLIQLMVKTRKNQKSYHWAAEAQETKGL